MKAQLNTKRMARARSADRTQTVDNSMRGARKRVDAGPMARWAVVVK
jgi:hypothetical protein